ncbi:MAG: hypothetical protein AAF587_08410 [Bacteroidota bacterium]
MIHQRILFLHVLLGGMIGCTNGSRMENTSSGSSDPSDQADAFIPHGYSMLDSASGHLNMDSIIDMILILKKDGEETSSEPVDHPEERPLLLLLGQANNQFRLATQNKQTVYCVNCGGMMGDPYQGLVIKDGYFSVEHYGGSGLRWSRIITYRYDPKEKHWFLHRDGGESFQVRNPDDVDTYMRTKKDFGTVRFEAFDIYQQTE